MRIYITNTQFYTSLILFSYATIQYFYILIWDIKDGPYRLKFMTWWNLYLNSFYFIIVLICDSFLFFKNRKMETINFF